MQPSCTLPYEFNVQQPSDMLQLEKVLRSLLGCQGKCCSFFQSREYIEMKFQILKDLKAGDVSPQHRVFCIPSFSHLLLHVQGTTVLVDTAIVQVATQQQQEEALEKEELLPKAKKHKKN